MLTIACGDGPSVQLKAKAKGTGGTEMGTGGTDATGGTIGIGGTIGVGGEGNEGGDGSVPERVCGNGVLEIGELCDDDNTDDDDGCSGDCSEVDPDYLCTEGQRCIRVVTCGNGVIEGDEVCDDRNTADDDGCSGACDEIEDGFMCVKPGQPCVARPVCGNRVREQGEQCDDGDTDSRDGCSATCQLEDGYFCPPGQDCTRLVCGDGNRTPDEECDDDNDDGHDGCAADCTTEDGWICGSSGCRAICGDGMVLGTEECDDENLASGDGCSSACRVEPNFDCDDDEPSTCVSTIVCGDGVLSPGEVCDPAISGQGDCFGPSQGAQACKGYRNTLVDPPVCNNGVVEYMEECDGNVTGCTNCVVDDGFVCPAANVCFRLPVCGDGLLQAGEQCDLGLVSGPGCVGCQIQPGNFCLGEPSICVASLCGDGLLAPDEECDDDDTMNGDGCSSNCEVEDGYVCPPGGCLPFCGDGIRTGGEECDLGSSPNPAACNNCKLQPGYKCGLSGLGPCVATVCPNATAPTSPPGSAAYIDTAQANAEPGEGCDDGNTVAGDGCGPTCQLEPAVTVGTNPTVSLTCGDGLKTGSEGCDDGNVTNGDGCSSGCAEESGWSCNEVLIRPATVAMAVTYRDFKSNGVTGGHPHFENVIANDKGIPGQPCTTANQGTCGRLDAEGKPQKATGDFSSIDPTGNHAAASARYATWFRNTNTLGFDVAAINGALTLTQVGGATSDVYEYSSTDYFPLNGIGHGNTCGSEVTGSCCNGGGSCVGRNFGFTTELRYFFQYQGGETLTFRGDDDVWVFINGRLAVDVGGVHCAQLGRVVLGDEDSDCSVHGQDYDGSSCPSAGNAPACSRETGEETDNTDGRFGLTKGGVYEIVLFHAERHTSQSNFRLTLQGFLAPRSSCQTNCGDGIKAGSEMCDSGMGMPATGYGTCLNNCTIQFCGDRVVNGTEACDLGANSDLYGTSGCAPGCRLPARCGDGQLQGSFGEECDRGSANQDGIYGGCSTSCELGPYCGDNQVTHSEQCDTPGQFETYGAGKCNYDCRNAPFCGDNIRNGPEICDGAMHCNAMCEFDPYCGDGLKTMNEACDYGPANSSAMPPPYGSCTTMCGLGPQCGDGAVQTSGGEECDEGTGNANNVYEGCTEDCLHGPRCGDGIEQSAAGEACDNGFNDDDYAYPGTTNPCGPMCRAVPFCGDGTVHGAFELCDDGADNDDGAYDGCTTMCEWSPYCGDGRRNGPEECDDGPDNTAYTPDGEGCSYECTRDIPYCGDGVRNGPEQCDDGEAENDGSYDGCNEDCTRAPYCGDRRIQRDEGESCDDGPTGSLRCSPQCRVRDVPR
jgi:fibro-slime domain-containing protein